MSRTPLRVIEITMTDTDDEDVTRLFDWLADNFPCCDEPDDPDHPCNLLSISATVHYMDDETGVPFMRPEGGVPVYTFDLDDHQDTSICGAAVSLPDESPSGVTTCTREPDHDGPHFGPLTWT